jgi:hypothetical protein
VEYFKECKIKLESVLGKQGTENHIKKAVFFISAGTNDFALNYFTLPIRRKSFTLLGYQQFLIQHVKEFIQVSFNYPHIFSSSHKLLFFSVTYYYYYIFILTSIILTKSIPKNELLALYIF